MWLGRFQLGEQVTVPLQCRDQNGTPTVPDVPPAIMAYSAAGKIKSDRMHVLDRYNVTGLYRYLLFLTNTFPVGPISIYATYRLGGAAFGRTYMLEVVDGGNSAGTIVSMHAMQRPAATYLIQMTDGGTRVFGRNPSA